MTADIGALDLCAATLQQDLDRLGWGATAGAAGLRTEVNDNDRWVDLYLPVVRAVFPVDTWRGKPVTGNFAEAIPADAGYIARKFQTGKLPSLRLVLNDYARTSGARETTRVHLPDLLTRFDAVLAKELLANGVEPSPTRLMSLLTFRYARGLGETVNAKYAPLPPGIYEYIAADVAPNVLLLNFSKRFNAQYQGDGRFVAPPIPLADAKKLGTVPAKMLADLYLAAQPSLNG